METEIDQKLNQNNYAKFKKKIKHKINAKIEEEEFNQKVRELKESSERSENMLNGIKIDAEKRHADLENKTL